jgi:sorting nexin-29
MYAKFKTGTHVSFEFKVNKVLRQRDAVFPLLFNVVLEIAIRRFTVETWGTIFDKCSQIMAYVDNVIIIKGKAISLQA